MENLLSDNKQHIFIQKAKRSLQTALPMGLKTSWWLIQITVPVSFAVMLLQYFGWLAVISAWVAPFFELFGLPGVSAIVLITSILTNIYSVVAVLSTLGLPEAEGTVLALMCLVSHAFIIETAIQQKAGVSGVRMMLVRLGGSFFVAWVFSLFSSGFSSVAETVAKPENVAFFPYLAEWLLLIGITILKIVVLVNLLMILQQLLRDFKLIDLIAIPFKPLLKLMGLPEKTTFLWLVTNILGLGYGGAILISEVKNKTISDEESDLLNHHVAISHSQLEDPLLFMTLGYSLPLLIVPRVLLAVLVVWLRKAEIAIRGRRRS